MLGCPPLLPGDRLAVVLYDGNASIPEYTTLHGVRVSPEIERLRAAIDDAERRLQDSIDAINRISEGLQEAKLSLNILAYSTIQSAETPALIAKVHGYIS